MQDLITLIEQIRQKQTEISTDLELLKNKESGYIEEITAIQRQQTEVAGELDILQEKMRQDKNGGVNE